MENQIINHKLSKSQTESTSLTVFNKELTKCIGQNVYVLGFTGGPEQLIIMSNLIEDIFGHVDLDDLRKVFREYQSGKRELKYSFNLTHISKALLSMGYITVEDRLNEAKRDEFYSFQNELLNPENKL